MASKARDDKTRILGEMLEMAQALTGHALISKLPYA
jgi:hypothetical protein